MSLDGNLSARLKEQISRESETIQGATQEQLNAMRSGLQGIYSGVLSTIEADMQTESRALAKRLRRLMLLPSLLLVMISLGISVGAWAFTQYQYQTIQEQRETLENLETLGVEPVSTDEGREYLVFPKGASLGELKTNTEGQPFVELMR